MLSIYRKLQISEQVGVTQLVPASFGIVLGTVAVMDKCTVVSFTKVVLDCLVIPTPGDNVIAGLGILPDPLP